MKETQDYKRLQNAVAYLKGKQIAKTADEMAKKMGYTKGTFSAYVSGNSKSSPEFLTKFEKTFNLKLSDFEKNDFENTKTEAKIIPYDDFMEVPYLPAYAQAGYLTNYAMNDGEADKELDTMLVPKEFEKGNYLVIEVSGDSMDDGTTRAICDGDKLLVKELDRSLWIGSKLYFKRNLFVVATFDSGIVVKQITDHNVNDGVIKCHSWNEAYKDFTVEVKDVLRLFYVKKIVERKIKF